jgi:hypothetical protein
VRDVKAEAASGVTSEPEDYDISISRVEQGHMVTFGATSQTMLLPGDVVEVKLKRQDSANSESVESLSTEAIPDLSLTPASILAEGSASPSR